MFSNYAPENLSQILDEIIASRGDCVVAPSNDFEQNCIVDLKVLSAWLFQDDALVTVHADRDDEAENVKMLVQNPHMSNVLLEQLSDYPCAAVRAAIAEHDHLPGQVAFAMSNDESVSVRYAIAHNLTTPKQILEQLTEDENPYVIARARLSLVTMDRLANARETGNIVDLNFKENFKAQNMSRKNKKQSRSEAYAQVQTRNVATH